VDRLLSWFSDASGEYQLTLRRGDGSGEERRLTSGSGTYYVGLNWSPDSRKLLTYDAAMMLRWVDAESGAQHDIGRSPTERSFDAQWSPDSRWVAFAEAEDNELSSIFLFDTEKGTRSRVTTSMTDDTSPAFSPDGKYLYFASERSFQPRFGPYDQVPLWSETTCLYLVTLQADAPHPFPPESDEVAVADGEDGKDGDETDDGKKDDEKKDGEGKKVEPTVIDLEGLGNRIVALDVPPGDYSGLAAAEGKLFYLKAGADGDGGEVMVFDLEKREAEIVLAKADGFELDAKGEKLLYRDGKTYGIVAAAADQKPAEKPLRVEEMKARSDPRAEWRQMFHDAWRLESDFFYDPGMHGVGWDHMRERYGQLVPYVTDRRDLDYILGELIGELGAGHAYVNGSDEAPRAKPVGVGLLGADFRLDAASGRYRLVGILTERDWNEDQRTPLSGPGIDVRDGDYLLAVDGKPLQAPTNPYALFENKVDVRTVLTVADKPGGVEREVVVLPIASDTGLRYVRWVEGNRRKVAELTGGKVGYLHLPDTAVDGVQAFAQAYYPQVRLEGLIIDERYNSGGFIPDFLLNILGQDILNLWKPRYGRDWRTPGTAFHGPMVMVSNSHAGSGGDALPYYFKKYGLGKVVGTRTWGGLIGISSRIPLMDGGLVTFPEFGLFNLEGAWDVENHGVDPDIVVENLPEEVNRGRDPQLERAVAEVLAAMKSRTDLPSAPEFPRDR
jgi:tricorn protease